MNGRCETCDVEQQCGYQYKPTECCNYRKFKEKVMTTCAHDFENAYRTVDDERMLIRCPRCHADITAEYLQWQQDPSASKSRLGVEREKELNKP